MKPSTLKELIQQGKNSSLEFKQFPVCTETVARELVAFANGSGGTVLLGVNDNGSISGAEPAGLEEWVMNVARTLVSPALSVTFQTLALDGKTIGIITVPKGDDKPYQTGEKHLVRIGSTNRPATQAELMRLFQLSGAFHYDQVAIPRTTMNDLNTAALDSYFTSYEIEYSKESDQERKQLLINTDILSENGELTVGGLLMFGINPSRYLPQAAIMFAHFDGIEPTAELIDRQEIIGTLPNMVDATLAVLKNNLRQPSTIVGSKRVDTATLPPDKVLREMLVNACVHRNYAISGSRIRVFIYNDRIECISPGRLPNTVTVEKLRSGVSYASNPVLLKFMDNLRYIDRLGRGFPMIFREMKKLGAQVEVIEFGEELRVIIPMDYLNQ